MVDIGIAAPSFFFEPTPEQWTTHQARLNKIRDELAAAGIQVTAEQFQGMPIDKILPECRRLNADLIIMGAHHHSGLEKLLFGTVTKDVLKRAGCPTLVIPDAELRYQDKGAGPKTLDPAIAVDS